MLYHLVRNNTAQAWELLIPPSAQVPYPQYMGKFYVERDRLKSYGAMQLQNREAFIATHGADIKDAIIQNLPWIAILDIK